MFKIMREGQGHREAVDAFDTETEAIAMLHEYRLSDSSAVYWIEEA